MLDSNKEENDDNKLMNQDNNEVPATSTTVHECSVDSLHTAKHIILEDEKIKRTLMNVPCHAVALIVGEYVPNYSNVDVHVHENNQNEILYDDVPEPAASVNTVVNTNESNNKQLKQDDNGVPATSAIHECSGDNLHGVGTANNIISDDDKIKRTHMNVPCHPVALVVGEYVPNYNKLDIDDNKETVIENQNEIIHDAAREPAASVNTVINTNENKKNRHDTNNGDPNQRCPGAVKVIGINRRSLRDSSAQFTLYNNSQSIIDESQSFYITDGDLAPIELLERVEAMPWVDEQRAVVHKNTGDVQQVETNMTFHQSVKHYLKKYCFIILLMILVISGIIIGLICGSGKCNKNINDTVNQDNTVRQDNTGNQNKTMAYQSFYTKTELINAVDIFISGENVTPSLEETYGNIIEWNVSSIQDFSHLFDAFRRNNLHRKFNGDISRWDVSSATNMSNMFNGAGSFRGDISKWNVSRVTDMSYFMAEANFFDSNLSRWDTSQIINASAMFSGASSFRGNGSVENWNVGNELTANSMFLDATLFDANLSQWDVSKMYDTSSMFYGASSFCGNGFVENWNVTNVLTAAGMFASATLFDANLSQWDVSRMNDLLCLMVHHLFVVMVVLKAGTLVMY